MTAHQTQRLAVPQDCRLLDAPAGGEFLAELSGAAAVAGVGWARTFARPVGRA